MFNIYCYSFNCVTNLHFTFQTDAGDPLVCLIQASTWYLIGISSPIVSCGTPGRPAVYTKLSGYSEWIATGKPI